MAEKGTNISVKDGGMDTRSIKDITRAGTKEMEKKSSKNLKTGQKNGGERKKKGGTESQMNSSLAELTKKGEMSIQGKVNNNGITDHYKPNKRTTRLELSESTLNTPQDGQSKQELNPSMPADRSSIFSGLTGLLNWMSDKNEKQTLSPLAEPFIPMNMNHSTSSEESMQDGQLETTNQGEQESHDESTIDESTEPKKIPIEVEEEGTNTMDTDKTTPVKEKKKKKKGKGKKNKADTAQSQITNFLVKPTDIEPPNSTIPWEEEEMNISTPYKKNKKKKKSKQKSPQNTSTEELEDDNRLDPRKTLENSELKKIKSFLADDGKKPNQQIHSPMKEVQKQLEQKQLSGKQQKETVQDTGTDLVSILTQQFAEMNRKNMETQMENQMKFQETLVKTVQSEISTQMAAQTTGLKEKIATYMAEEITEWKLATKEKTDELENRLNIEKKDTATILENQIDFQKSLDFFNEKYEDNKKWRERHDEEESNKIEVFNLMVKKVKTLEKKVEIQEEERNRQERIIRKRNMRVSNLKPENETEAPTTTFCKFVLNNALMKEAKNIEDIRSKVDQCFRIGPKKPGRPRQMLVKMLTVKDRDEIMILARSKGISKKIKPVFFQDDLTPEDWKTRNEALGYMEVCHNEGKEPRFFDGILKIKGPDGEKVIVEKEIIRKFNKKQAKKKPEEKKEEFASIKPQHTQVKNSMKTTPRYKRTKSLRQQKASKKPRKPSTSDSEYETDVEVVEIVDTFTKKSKNKRRQREKSESDSISEIENIIDQAEDNIKQREEEEKESRIRMERIKKRLAMEERGELE